MIVTCPSCASKYRVRDEAVPTEGAELECPTCKAIFVAHPPKLDAEQLAQALERMTRGREAAEQRVAELERQVADAVAVTQRLTDELARARSSAGDSAELVSVKQMLFDTQKKLRATAAELDVANTLIGTLQTEVTVLRAGNNPALAQSATQKVSTLQAEVARLRVMLEQQQASSAAGAPSAEVQALIAAVGPMLWGLDQALGYLEQFAGNDATLAGHVKQLRLLQKVLVRLSEQR